jgi:hypothetical protein
MGNDQIDKAIEQAAATKPVDHIQNVAKLPNGAGVIQIIVPKGFDSDQFEYAIGMLIQLRSVVIQEQAARASQGIVVPDRKIVAPDGRKLA